MSMRRACALLVAAAVALTGCFGSAPNAPPVVTAHASVATVAAGDEVIFTGSAVDPDGSVVKFEWDFDSNGAYDFSNATRGTALFEYALPGAYAATFRATDDQGATASTTVNVTVVARFAINADWGAVAGFAVHGVETLDPAKMVVTATPTGAAPTNFTIGDGLAPINDTSYHIALPSSTLERYNVIRVEVFYNGTPSGLRIFRAVPFFGSENDSSVAYNAHIVDVRILPTGNTTLTADGQLSAVAAGATGVLSFAGSATSLSSSGSGGNFDNGTYDFEGLFWNHSLSLDTGSFSAGDYAWAGSGVLSAVSTTRLPSELTLTEFRGQRTDGNLVYLRASGNGTFGSPGTADGGNISYTADGAAPSMAVDGEGVVRLALRVVESRVSNGTNGGAAYFESNASETLQAASDQFVNSQIFVSWNMSGMQGVTPFSSSGSRYVDSDGDGRFNPDLRPTLPFDAQYFVGLSPADLEQGDLFTVRNPFGASVALVASNLRMEVLSAQGFTTSAVEVVTLTGPVAGGLFTGTLSGDVVSSGVHNLLRLRWHTAVASASGSYTADWTLHARGA